MTQPAGPDPDPGDGCDLEAEVSAAYRAHAAAAYRTALRAALGDPGAAEDGVQDAFMEAARQWDHFRRLAPGELRARLCNLARYRVIDTWRKTRSEHPADPGDPAALLERPDHRHDDDSVIAAITASDFWKRLGASADQRAARAAYLRWDLGWTKAEIASFLGVEQTTVGRDLKAVQALAQELAAGSTPGHPGGEER